MILKDVIFDESVEMENGKELGLYFTAPVRYLPNYFDIELNEGDVSMEIWLEFPNKTDETLDPDDAIVVAVSPTDAEGSDYDWHDVLLDYNTKLALIHMYEKHMFEQKARKLSEERLAFLNIAYNAITLGQIHESYPEDKLLEELGCSKEVLEEIMG